MSNSFTTFTPSYENILSRMNRLKHSSQNHRSVNNQSHKSLLPVPVDNSVTRKYSRNGSPNRISLAEDSVPSVGKFTGRVTKNVGLKKFNQRQLREVLLNREPNVSRAEEKSPIRDIKSRIRTQNQASDQKWENAGQSKLDPIRISEESEVKQINWHSKLIPGKMYKRSVLYDILQS